MKREIIVGSRKSKLALTQTNWVIKQLQAKFPDQHFKIHEIITKGDQILDVTLSKVGGKGLFISEIEQALLDGVIDFAVHSMKDVPAELAKGLVIASIPKRETPFDCLVFDKANRLSELKKGATIGTSSLRRAAQLRKVRPDLNIHTIRGNIDTRLKKLKEENFDAIVLAEAGLKRMGWLTTELKVERLSENICLPAVGQGALAIECRENDQETRQMLKAIHDLETAYCVQAERTFLRELDGGCEVPVACFATKQADHIQLAGLVSSIDGSTILNVFESGSNPIQVGKRAAEILLEKGAATLIKDARENG
ncbi:hydroxymethylbilane synthase [Listeria sp. PSOL-1]|uniref:hydroxymethylbilane synthase n=1 Tax=Listeria sp. PSOL-1 TaxID=1844999 RepID=UPI0013D416DE|nr:hydroxymethylbilane synthase [Listeria sp. PSOL-1]